MLISTLMDFLHESVIYINFICYLIIFVGGFYVALHSRVLPNWVITFIWYTGVCALLTTITIIIYWVDGPSSEFSYYNIGSITEVLLHLHLAILVLLLFFHTIWKDFKGMKKRNSNKFDCNL